MTNGPSSPDSTMGIPPPEIRTPEPQKNFTPLPEFRKPITTEPPKFEEPTATDNPEMDKLLADILAQGKPKNPQEVVRQVEKNIPVQTKKSQGFIAKIVEWIKNLFRNLFR